MIDGEFTVKDVLFLEIISWLKISIIIIKVSGFGNRKKYINFSKIYIGLHAYFP